MMQGGIIFICGDGSRMEPDVRHTLDTIYREKMNITTSFSWVDELIKTQKYQTDVWASF